MLGLLVFMLNYSYESEAEIPQEYKALYKDVNGFWVIQINGVVPKAKADELLGEKKKLQAKLKEYEGVDTEKYRELLEKEEELAEGKVIKKDGVEAAIAQRLEKLKSEHAKQLAELQGKMTAAEAAVRKFQVEKAILDPARQAGVRASAIPDLLARAQQVWQMVDGNLRAIGPDGSEIYGPTADPLKPEEWLAALTKDASHLFETNTGSGAKPGQGGPFAGPNPWAKDTLNLTNQQKVLRENPQLAERLRTMAGK